MQAVWVRARSELRERWRAWFALALLLGGFAGASMAMATGARRTDSVYERFAREQNAADVFIGDFSAFSPVFWQVDFDSLEALPYVRDVVRMRYFLGEDEAEILAPVDPRLGVSINRYKILQGRMPRGPNEVLVPFASPNAERSRLNEKVSLQINTPAGPVRREVTVVGIGAAPGDFPPLELLGGAYVASTAFAEQNQELFAVGAAVVTFDNGVADIARFDRDIERLSGGKVVTLLRYHEQAANVQRSFGLQAAAGALMAAALAVATVLIAGQTLARQISLGGTEVPTLRALGMSGGQVAGVTLIQSMLASLLGMLIATGVSWLGSSLFPTGIARVAELDTGPVLDLVVIGLGALGISVVALVSSVLPLRTLVRNAASDTGEQGASRASRLVGVVARIGGSPPMISGVRLAVERGHGRTAVPIRSTILAVALGIGALTAALTFAASLRHLLDEPMLYGLGWDHAFGFSEDGGDPRIGDQAASLRDEPLVEAVAVGTFGVPVTIANGTGTRIPTQGITLDPVKGSVLPPFIEGRFPDVGEVALGRRTAERLGVDVGDEVLFGVQGARAAPARVVGLAVLPPISETSQFGEGVVARFETIARVAPAGAPIPPPDSVLVRFPDGADKEQAVAALTKKLRQVDMPFDPPPAADLISFGRVQNMPVILAGVLALLATGALAHVLLTSIRRRARDLAILKTLGFHRAQTWRTVQWQASTTTLIALALGIPAGIAFGRWLWILLADRLGVTVEPVVDWRAVAISVPAALIVAQLIAALPGYRAARTKPAAALRIE